MTAVYGNGRLVLSGPLTVDTVPMLVEQVKRLQSKFANNLEVDLAATANNDTAGLAWLINFKAAITQSGGQLKVVNTPSSLMKLSRLSDAHRVLDI